MFSSRRRHTRYWRDWSSDVCSSDLFEGLGPVHARVDNEGGRDDLVTGALAKYCREHRVDVAYVCGSRRLTRATDELAADHRSEERGVGKECRSRWSTDR